MKKNWTDFWIAALIRAIRTAAVLSILTSIATGLPEVDQKGAHEK